jgi:hypothetical protein
MSYRLGCTEDNVDVKKVVNKAQEYYNAQEKREWVKWVGKTLQLFAVPKSFLEIFSFSSSIARFFTSPHNTYLFALKISGFTLYRPPEHNSTKELVSQRF